MNQKARVRSACRVVKSGRRARTACAGDRSRRPSTWWPCSSGAVRMTSVIGNPISSTRMPDTNAVSRQPNVPSARISSGISSPPTAIPVDIRPRAVARRRSNHFTTAIVRVMKPASPAPSEMTKNDSTNISGELIRLNQKKPSAMITRPICITRRGPMRSTSQPCAGPITPLSTRDIENATANSVLLQPNSSRRTATYAPKAWKTSSA